MEFSFADISEFPHEALLPPLDREGADPGTSLIKNEWVQTGVATLEGFLPQHLIDLYSEVRAQNPNPGGWRCPTPYMHVPEILDISLYAPLMKVLEELIGEPMGLHLNLTGWVSTERNWHQDDYLNPAHVNSWYAAVWMALEDIHPDSGPFQFVVGSHKWPLTRREKLFQFVPKEIQESDLWPSLTQDAVSRAFEQEIEARGAKVVTYLPKKGDVLIWHGRLAHRGSTPRVPGMPRKSLIAHYSGINHRDDMKERKFHTNGQIYFSFPHSTEKCGRTYA